MCQSNKEQKKKSPDIEHPIVRTHPITGRKALYLCPGMTTEIVGWDPAESREMLDYLFEWTIQPRYVYSHAWRPGDVIVIDNLRVMHGRRPFTGSRSVLAGLGVACRHGVPGQA